MFICWHEVHKIRPLYLSGQASPAVDRPGAGQPYWLVLATGPVLDLPGFIGLRGNGLTPSKIDDFLSKP